MIAVLGDDDGKVPLEELAVEPAGVLRDLVEFSADVGHGRSESAIPRRCDAEVTFRPRRERAG